MLLIAKRWAYIAVLIIIYHIVSIYAIIWFNRSNIFHKICVFCAYQANLSITVECTGCFLFSARVFDNICDVHGITNKSFSWIFILCIAE